MALPVKSIPFPEPVDVAGATEVDVDLARISLVNGDHEVESATFDNYEDMLDYLTAMCIENNWKLIKWDGVS